MKDKLTGKFLPAGSCDAVQLLQEVTTEAAPACTEKEERSGQFKGENTTKGKKKNVIIYEFPTHYVNFVLD